MENSNTNHEIRIGKYANVLLDRWFKRTFGINSRKRLTELMLQLLIPEHEILSIEIHSPEHVNPYEDDKDIRVDVECTDSDGTRFIVEMQMAPQHHFYERAIFNSCFGVQQQIKVGQRDYGFSPVYFIGILLESIHEDSGNAIYRYRLREDKTGEIMSESLQYMFIELPNVVKNVSDARTLTDRFLFSLKNMATLDSVPAGWEKDEIIQLLFESAKISNFTPSERVKYINDMTTKRDFENMLVYAEDKGIARGIEQGIEKGREANRIETSRNLKRLGVDVETICQATGLSKDIVEAL